MGKLTICVYGAASNTIDSVFITETEKLGKEIARRQHRIIYGGGAEGVMGACARGAARAGGEVTGVVPFFMEEFEEINHKCTEIIRTETMGERKQVMEREADAFITAPGGIGTLDEFFQILTLVELGRKKAPVILYNIDGYYDDLISFIHSGVEKGFIRPKAEKLMYICATPEEALSAIEEAVSP